MDVFGKLLLGFLLRESWLIADDVCGAELCDALSCADANILLFFQLVSSATSDSDTDAFNFLSKGAGTDVFEVFLKVTHITYARLLG